MLDLCECDVVEELAGNISLVTGESFNGDEDGRGGNDKSIEGIDPRH